MIKHQTRIDDFRVTTGCSWSFRLGASLVLGGWCLVLLCSQQASAQSYTVDWFKVAGGGGTSTGGAYSVSATIGQHDASPLMSGGNFSLTGGFWSLFAVQSSGAPRLTITLTSTNTAMVSWPSPSAGFALQQNTNSSTSNWTVASEPITDNGTTKFIIVNPPVGTRFYRLFKP